MKQENDLIACWAIRHISYSTTVLNVMIAPEFKLTKSMFKSPPFIQ